MIEDLDLLFGSSTTCNHDLVGTLSLADI